MSTPESKTNIIKEYIKYKAGAIAAIVTCNLIMLSVFILYDLDVAPFFYALLINAIILIVFIIISFVKFYNSHIIRKKILESALNEGLELAEAEYLADKDYHEIISLLNGRCNELSNRLNSDIQDSNDYYTIWVHQIKTPISVLSMLLKDDTAKDRQCRDELFKIEQYVDMVLNYLRLGSETNDLVLKEQDLDKLIKGSIRKYAALFINRKLSISYEPVDIKLVTDEKWFSFILEQLLSNAVKYTMTGGITIKAEPGEVSITDTGIGIAPEDVPRIFEKGYTGFNGRSGRKSSGLGLYLCSLAAKKLSLELSVDSEPGVGSTFRIKYVPDNASQIFND